MIKNFKKKLLVSTVIGLLLIALVGCTTTTNPSNSDEAESDKPNVEKEISMAKAEEHSKKEYSNHEETKSPLESNQYYCYYASLANGQEIQICLYPIGNEVKGTYVNEKNEETKLEGVLDGTKIKLTDDKEFFSGDMETVDNITGTISITGEKPEEIKLELSDIALAEYGHRYANMGADDDAQIDNFAKELKMLVKYNKKDKIADIVCYPILVNVDGKKVEIHNREEFVKNYDQIFNKSLKEAISTAFTKNMFSRSEGVMFGSGMKNIWFTYRDFNKKDELCIIAINN